MIYDQITIFKVTYIDDLRGLLIPFLCSYVH